MKNLPAWIEQAAKIIFLAVAKKLCDLTAIALAEHLTKYLQLDEIMPNVNHNGIYIHNTK